MKRIISLGLILAVLSGCSVKPKYSLDQLDKALLTTAVVAQIADGYTTMRALDNPDNYETNPLYGEHPSDGKIIAIKVVGIGATFWLAKDLPPTPRKWVLGFLSLLYGGVSFSNWEAGN